MSANQTISGGLAEISFGPPRYDSFRVWLLPDQGPVGESNTVITEDVFCDGRKVTGPELMRWLADGAGQDRPRVTLTGYFGDYPYVERAEFARGGSPP